MLGLYFLLAFPVCIAAAEQAVSAQRTFQQVQLIPQGRLQFIKHAGSSVFILSLSSPLSIRQWKETTLACSTAGAED